MSEVLYMNNPETHTCECGYTWRQGQDGSHSCSPYYRKRIAALEVALSEVIAWDLSTEFKCDYGSNGERDHFRKVAEQALNS